MSGRERKGGASQPPLIAIVGPTGVGKSALAMALARRVESATARWPVEVVSADSRQVYRYMDIGTAKPTAAERAQVPHYLIDVVNPDEEYTLATYQADAYRAVDGIVARGRLPLLVGGSGLYVRAVAEGLAIPRVPPDPAFRREMEERARREGAAALYAELVAVDPVAAEKIDPRNLRRVVRAMEVYWATGKPFSLWQRSERPPYRILTIGLTLPRAELYRRIDQRVDRQIADGWVEETERLLAMGYHEGLPAMSGLGYCELCAYLRGKWELAAAVQSIKYATHRFARQQYTWFRLEDPCIGWFEAGSTDQVAERVGAFWEGT